MEFSSKTNNNEKLEREQRPVKIRNIKEKEEYIKRQTIREKAIELLKTGWYSGYAMNIAVKSSGGAPRITELKTTDPLEGWKIIERRNITDNCQDYMLVPDDKEAEKILGVFEELIQIPKAKTATQLIAENGQTQLFKVESNYF